MILFLVTVGQQFGKLANHYCNAISPELSTLFPCVDNRNNSIFEGEIYINIEQ